MKVIEVKDKIVADKLEKRLLKRGFVIARIVDKSELEKVKKYRNKIDVVLVSGG